ncbi:uncharacterized protein DNG_09576 [Cephalotrichum gorgonifer]|uniref:Alb1-domain-containing protein n=1 Tax=Cephalotrichum gorgonifer TaxID=2041049 RepID=A0AAE8N8E4_9PEZI|nr:uncharacterized protein DNG_09576 [Cephalotrichum gorgonifer]
MGKPVPNKKKRGVSLHSREARRATSPSIDVDKSLKEIEPPRPDPILPSVLAARHNAGVQKRSTRKAVTSAKAKRKHARNVELAEAISAKVDTRVQKSIKKDRAVKGRAKAWEVVNQSLGKRKPGAAVNAFAALGGGGDSGEDDDDSEEVVEEKEEEKAEDSEDAMDDIE